MMSTITIRVDGALKEEASALFRDLGMDMTTACTLFLRKAVIYGTAIHLLFDCHRTGKLDHYAAGCRLAYPEDILDICTRIEDPGMPYEYKCSPVKKMF